MNENQDLEIRVTQAHERIEESKKQVSELETQLAKLLRNHEVLEVSGQNPDAAIEAVKKQIRDAEVEQSRARQAFNRLFSDNQAAFRREKQARWFTIHERTIVPSAKRLQEIADGLRRVATEIAELTTAKDEVEFDEQIQRHNKLHEQYKAPGNLRLDPSEALSLTIQQAVRAVLVKSDISAAVNALRQVLKIEPLKTSGEHAADYVDPKTADFISTRNAMAALR